MTRIRYAIGLIILIATHGVLPASLNPQQPSVHQRDNVGNVAPVNLTLPDSFDFTIDDERYTAHNFQPPYTPIFVFYRFLIACMNNVLLDGVSEKNLFLRPLPSCSPVLFTTHPPRDPFKE